MSKRKNKEENPERSDKRKTTVLGVAVVVSLATLIALVVLIGPRLSGFLVAGTTEFSHQQAISQEFSQNTNYTFTLEKLPSENFTLKSLMVSGSVIGDGAARVYLVSGGTRLRVFDSSNLKEKVSPITAFSVAEQPEVSTQPELPPSSELDNAQGGAGTDTTPAGSSGVENPPAEQSPAEQPPVTENQTLPAENLTQEISPINVTNETLPAENATIPENVTNITNVFAQINSFQSACIDTCSISEFLNASTYTLEIEVDSGTTLALDSATYTLLIPKTEKTNVSNETVFFVTNIENAKSNKVDAVIEFVNPSTSKIEAVGQSNQADQEFTGNVTTTNETAPAVEAQAAPETAKPTLLQGAAVASENMPSAPIEEAAGAPGLDIPKGEYDIKIRPQDSPIQEIVLNNVDVQQNVTEFIRIDDTPESNNSLETYAIDPTPINFSSAKVTVTAKGTGLLKCKDWDFDAQTCTGKWTFVQNINPGENYTFELSAEDPGFKEIYLASAEHLDSSKDFISNIYNETKTRDQVWSEQIHSGEYVRAYFDDNMTNGNVINIYPRNLQGSDIKIEIYDESTSALVGETLVISREGQYNVPLSGMSGFSDTFLLKVVSSNPNAHIEFDYIHDSNWVVPNSYSADGNWANGQNTYDDNVGTYAADSSGAYSAPTWGSFITLSLTDNITSDKLRAYADYGYGYTDAVQVDVYDVNSSSWITVRNGAMLDSQWDEMQYGQTLTVNAARFRWHYNAPGAIFWLYEFQFSNKSEMTLPSVVTNNATSVEQYSAVLQGNLANDGGEPCNVRFEYGITDSYGNVTPWLSDKRDTGSQFTYPLSGLTYNQNYHYRAQANNSLGIVNGSDAVFTTHIPEYGWLSPNSYADPNNKWIWADRAYDDLVTYESKAKSYHLMNDPNGQWSSPMILNITPSIRSDMLRFYAKAVDMEAITVSVLENGEWVQAYSGSYSDMAWNNISYPAGNVSAAKFEFKIANNGNGEYWELYDVDFLNNPVTVTINDTINDANGNPLNHTLTVVNETGDIVYSNTGTSMSPEVLSGTYNLTVEPENNTVQSIEFADVRLDANVPNIVDIDTPPAENNSKIYALDPTSISFASAEVTATANGNLLYKCKGWDFENRICNEVCTNETDPETNETYQTCSDWTPVQSITPGEQYTFTLTPEDPAYLDTFQDAGLANDSYVYQGSSGTNYGTSTTIYVQSRSSSRNMRTFLYFNLSSIPSDATITSANLSLYKTGGTGSSTRTYNAHRVIASWIESGITWTNQPAVSGTLTSSNSVATGTNNIWEVWSVTSDVRGFVNGTYSNYGWRIIDSSESSGTQYASNFASEDNTNATIRPVLNVSYIADKAPNSTLVSPANGNVTTIKNVTFSCNATDDVNLKNITLYWNYTGSWGADGSANVTGTSNSTAFAQTNLNNGAILWNCRACDNASHCVFAPANWTVTVNVSDTTPPASITNLASPLQGTTWIYWNWTKPADSDFNYAKIWIDSSYVANVSDPGNSYNATGFSAGTSHTISIQTVDDSNNVNTTFVNSTAQTLAISAGQNISIPSANGTAINATLTIINSTGQTVYLQTGTNYNFNLFAGNYTITIQPATSASVKSITYYNYTVDGSFALPGFDEPTPAAGSISEFAVNPLGQFQTATLTVNLTADVLTKCDNYTFTMQTCEENQWHTIGSGLTSGTLYNITLTPGDPGFAMFNGTSLTNDTQIYQASPNNNYGAATTMIVGKWNAANRAYRSLIKFNLSSVPSGVRIDKANLTFYVTATDAGARTHNVYKVYDNRSWVELQATWNNYATGNAWTTAGGDYNATLSTSTGVGVTGYYSFNVTNDVQIFADNQSKNQGWIIIDSNEATQSTRKTYTTSNSGTANQRPLLQVNWTDIQAPRWSSQSQNATNINNTDSVKLSAYWTDNVNLSYAVLSTNETGAWANKTGVYGSPMQIGPSTGNWSNFTWSNSSASGIISWAIWANDTQGNWNVTANGTINVTIPNTAPSTTTPTLDPATAYKTSTLYCNATLTDAQQTSLTAYWTWYKNGTVNLTGSKAAITNGTNANITTLASGNLTKGDTWICRVMPNDGTLNGTAVNSTGKTIQNSAPTTPTSLTPATGIYGGTNNTIPINCSGSTDADNDAINYAIDAYYNSAWNTINASGTGIYNWNISALSSQTNVALRCNATDGTNTTTYYTPSVNITIDNTKPSATAISPANNSLDGDGSVLFNCSATDSGIGLANISLYLNSVLNQTNTVTGSSNSTTFNKTLANNNYNWYCRATDSVGNFNDSVTYTLTVNTAAVPVSSNYSGNTTNWAAQSDLTNVCTATLDIPGIGQISWYNCVNASFQNFNTNVNISNNFIAVNFGLNPTFNTSAHLIIRNLTWDSDPEILMNGILCDNVTVCQNATYDNVTGVLTFDTTHFTNFSTVGNARLVIWDQNDSGMPGGNLPACLGSQINFFANYTRSANGNPIVGATCTLNFTDSLGNSMGYNATSTFYEYNRTFGTTGLKTYNISCVKTTPPARQRITLSDSVNITDCTPPQWSNNQSSAPAKYNASQLSVFNITWTDLTNVSTVQIEGNWSGSPINYTATLISGNTGTGVWSYNQTLPAGTYYWKSYANDTSNNRNSTSSFIFTIAKADNPVNLYLNGTQANNTYAYPQAINATGITLVGTVFLYRDATLLTSGSSPQTNVSVLGNGTYAFKANSTGNANYSDNSTGVTYYAFVNRATSTCSLSYNPVSPVTYGIAVNVSCSCTNPEALAQLYRNSTNVTSEIGQNVTLGGGTWGYVCNVSQTQNYSSATNSSNFVVNLASSQVNLTLDGVSANKTVEVGSTVNLTAALITPASGTVQLYRAGSQINSGTAPISNLSTFSTLGTFNITEIYPATQNYSASSMTWYVITQDTTKPNVYLTSPANGTAIASHTQSFVFNATDNYYTTLNCTLYINNIASGTNASVVVNTPTTITNTSIPEGNNNWKVNCTDGSGNTNQSETRILTVDVTPPVITHVRPVQNDIVGYNVTLDVDITDNLLSVSSAWYEIRNLSGIVKSGTLPGPSYQDVWNSKTVQDGNYTFRAYANDTVGNQANSSVNFTVDNTAPFIQIITPQNNSLWNSNFNLNVTLQNTRINSSTYNITNSTGSVVQSNSNSSVNSPTFSWTDAVNVAALPTDTYIVSVYAKDSIGYETVETSVFKVDKVAPQYSNIAVSPASPATYSPSQSYQFNSTWTDNIAISKVIFEFNGTNYTDSIQTGNVYSKSFTGLNAGNYTYKWYANDTTGNWNSTGTFIYTVNKAPTTTTLYLNGSQSNLTITYGQTSNATAATSAGSLALYRNSIGVGNPDIQILGVNTYNYTAINSGDSNYLPSSATWYLIVNKANPAVNLLLDGAAADKNVTYPTSTNATGYEANTGDSDVNYTLFRNGASIGSGALVSDVQTLGANTYTYVYNTSGGTNYTSATISRTLIVNVQPTAVDLFLNGAQNNLTIIYPAQINATAIGYNGTVALYRNGTGVTNPDISNLAAGYYNYTAVIPSDVNRTGSSKTFFLTVQKATPSLNLLLNGAASNLSVTYPTQTNATGYESNAGDGDLVYTLYRGSTTIGSGSTVSDVQTLGVNTYVYTYNASGGTNYTSATLSRVLTVNQGSTDVRLFLNGVEGNTSQTYGTNSNATATLNVSGLTFQLFRDSVQVASGNSSINEIATLAAQTYNYTALFAGNTNYTGDSQTYFLTINRATPTFSLLLNGNDSDVSVSVLTPVTINASATAPAGANVELYEDNAFVANGSAPSALRNYATAGNRTWKVNISQTQNYTSGSKNHTVVVFDNSPPQYSSLVASPSSPTTYSPSQTYQFNATWTDNVAVSYVALQFNGTNYSVSNSGSVYYRTSNNLAAGNYTYIWYANDTSNNWNNTGALTYTINKAIPVLTLNASPGWTNAYGTQTNISCAANTAEVTPQLFRNGASIPNPDVQTLGVNVYNYTCNNTVTQNYTTTTTTNNLTITKVADTVNLYLNGNQSNLTVIYGTQSNATATSTSGTQQLYRDNVGVSNPEIATLGYGTYAYKANSTGNANYTASAGVTYYLNVGKIPSAITLLLNGTNGDFNVNRSQSVNITGIRTTGEGSMQLYDNGTLINSGAPVITNITSYATLGQRNITLNLPETQNYSASAAMHYLNVYGILSASVTAPTGTPKYYEGQNITFKGYVHDELGNPIDGATVTFEPINGSYVYACSSSSGEGSGIYNCTLDTTGMASPRTYNVRINATKTNYLLGTYTNSSIFFLESGQKANLLLHKIPSVQTINSSQITYNVSLHLANGRGTSDNTTLKDPDANQTWNEGSIYGAQEVIESYLLTYSRGSSDSTITLQKANVTGYDPFYNTSLFVESNQPSIIIPQNITGAQLTLVKNILFQNQTTTNITYTIVDTVVNSGGSDLSGIAIVDSDIGLTTTANIARGNSATYSGNITITKNSQSFTYNFTQTSAFANSQFFYSNQPSVQIPGYGGPYDVVITSLPSSVNAGSSITGVVEAINMNTEVSEDRTLTTWIEDSNHTVLALDVRTIFIGRNQSAFATITLTAPSTAGTYNFVSVLIWPTATANATKAFTVTAVTPPTPPAPAPGGAGAVTENITNVTNVTIIQPIAVIPNDIIQDLITLINSVRTIEKQPMDEQMQLLEEDIEDYIVKAEDAAAQGKYDEARNDIRTAYGKLQIYNRLTPSILPTVQVSAAVKYSLIGTALATVIFIIVFFVRKLEEEAAIELLREERKHLEKLYDKVDDYLNRKRKPEHEA